MNRNKIILLSATLLGSVAALAACGGPKGPAKLVASYDFSSYSLIEQMGWTVVDNYQLNTYADKTYTLIFTEDMSGPIDGGFETKGHRVIITMGTYTVAAASDGMDGHVDFKLSASPIVYAYQHEKGYSRNTDIVGASAMIDTSNWTEAMTEATAAAYPNGKEDILKKYGSAKVVTAEEPTANAEDPTLRYVLLENPRDDENGAKAPSYDRKIAAAYDVSSYSAIEQMGWTIYNNDLVINYASGNYERIRHTDMFGPIDGGFEAKGTRNIITTGKFTQAKTASDGMDGHADLKLDASSRVVLVQHEKGWSRGTDVVGTPLLVDTDNWTDVMTEAVQGTYESGKEGFLAAYGRAEKGIVEDPTLNAEDTTLAYRIVGKFEAAE